ncbi:MAG: hypothetical protein F6K40_39065 [Okeania sp. SIO3I5]|uniref:hypothetical protein n=1 Tax=Okeania sp. SIO3I5 TaxID=2607805 RepID=UPI0013BA865B|nr:hypothetical protein [Okeania sp. SIO3I5]NEQ41863.1 hypothetical protein [Okeania sp. SIO3I5]
MAKSVHPWQNPCLALFHFGETPEILPSPTFVVPIAQPFRKLLTKNWIKYWEVYF